MKNFCDFYVVYFDDCYVEVVLLCNVVRIIIGSLKLVVRYFFVCLVIDIYGVCKGESEYLWIMLKVSIYCELDWLIK